MQFGIVIFINIILWALFYLVISLKLERSASEFREKRLRREMDEVIREFNETAERNISLLENRIAAMKRVLQQAGGVKGIDVSIGYGAVEGEQALEGGDLPDKTARPFPERFAENGETAGGGQTGGGLIYGETVSEEPSLAGLWRVLKQAAADTAGRLKALKGEILVHHNSPGHDTRGTGTREGAAPAARVAVRAGNPAGAARHEAQTEALARTIEDVRGMAHVHEVPKGPRLGEEEISNLFSVAEDKYALISSLYSNGYAVETLSRCSGISHGEINLVLNLNRSM
jgi:hypothetical protein